MPTSSSLPNFSGGDVSSDPPDVDSSRSHLEPESPGDVMTPFSDDSEAIEVEADSDVNPSTEDEGEGEDLFGDGMENDYRKIDRLDTYDETLLDQNAYSPLDPGERRAAEMEMQNREMRSEFSKRRLPAALMPEEESDAGTPRASKKHRRKAERAAGDDMEYDRFFSATSDVEEEDQNSIQNLEARRGVPTREWVTMDAPRNQIMTQFGNFLRSYVDDKGVNVHAQKVRAMCANNGESLVIKYTDLALSEPLLGIYVADVPAEMLEIFDTVAKDFVLSLFPEYQKIHSDIHVRISDLPVSDNLRDIRQIHLNSLVKVCGVVTRRTGVFPQLKYVKYDCGKCGFLLGPYHQDQYNEIQIGSCPQCQSKGPFNINVEQTVYRNFQKITLQESPGTVPAGRLPRQKEVILLWDLVDSCKPGDEIEVTGIYKNNFDTLLNTSHGFPVFSTVIEANHIRTREDQFDQYKLTDEDIKEIRELAKDERIGEKVINSIAPSIHGHQDIKTAIALAMFGGESKNPGEKHRIRGDINVLLLGDPGTAKSQFLKYVEKTGHRTVFTTGQGASAVGLTASVRKDPITREWTLEGGALVLADKGICLIDEFDKMNDQDRTSIHEAMEQQSISISKAGIITSLQARCCVIAAANPIRGRYDPSVTFSQNVELTEPIISRFDVLCVVRDTIDPMRDESLANFVVSSHIRHHPNNRERLLAEQSETPKSGMGWGGPDGDSLPQDVLRKYMLYAKMNVRPKLQNMDQDKIARLYSELRRESMLTGSIPITVRHVESMIRLSEAHAKMHLRDYVRDDDVNMAIRVALESFISTQKYSAKRDLTKSLSKYLSYKKDNNELLLYVLGSLVNQYVSYHQMRYGGDFPGSVEIEKEDLETRAHQLQIFDLSSFYQSKHFVENNFSLDLQKKVIVKSF